MVTTIPKNNTETNDERDFRNSRPLNGAIADEFRQLCHHMGITHIPQLRMSDRPTDAIAPTPAWVLMSKNAVVIDPSFEALPSGAKQFVLGHELAHHVFNDRKSFDTSAEPRADRFAMLVSGQGEAWAQYLERTNTNEIQQRRKGQADGSMDRPTLFAKTLYKAVDRFKHGNMADRLESLRTPLKTHEIEHFTKAITKYNQRMAAAAQPDWTSRENARPAGVRDRT